MIPRDKLYHLAVGAAIAALASLVMPLYAAFVISVIAGAGKEIYDDLHPETHTCDGLDLIATATGGLIATLILIGLK